MYCLRDQGAASVQTFLVASIKSTVQIHLGTLRCPLPCYLDSALPQYLHYLLGGQGVTGLRETSETYTPWIVIQERLF